MKRTLFALSLLALSLSTACVSVKRQTVSSSPWGTRINGKEATVVIDCEFCLGRKNCQIRGIDGFYRKCR